MGKSITLPPYHDYDTLSEGYIRLLTIHRDRISAFQEPIQISLKTYQLSSCPPYVALSYTWGDPTLRAEIDWEVFTTVSRCYPVSYGDNVIRVTKNLRHALFNLRSMDEIREKQRKQYAKSGDGPEFNSKFSTMADPELYWIDAICINQDDIAERSMQVALMGKINTQAYSTTVWLGGNNRDISLALSVLEQTWTLTRSMRPGSYTTTDLKRAMSVDLERHNITRQGAQGLVVFFTLNWFSRLWILQEVVLSSRINFLCGNHIFQFSLVERATQILVMKNMLMSLADLLPPNPYYQGRLRRFSDFNAMQQVAGMSVSRHNFAQHGSLDYREILQLTSEAEVTDPRDRVYGALGMISQLNGATIAPDYNLTVEEVYLDFARFLLKSYNDLDILTFSSDQSIRKIKNLPSWCPDFSVVRGSTPAYPGSIVRTWNMQQLWNHNPNIALTERWLLQVDGFKFDTILRTADHCCDTEYPPDSHGIAAQFELTVIHCRSASSKSRSNTLRNKTSVEILRKTLMLDHFVDGPAHTVDALTLPTLIAQLYMDAINRLDRQPSSPVIRERCKHDFLEDLDRLEYHIGELLSLEPHSWPFLPEVSGTWLVDVKRNSLSDKQDQIQFLAKILMHEIPGLRKRAVAAGLEDELNRTTMSQQSAHPEEDNIAVTTVTHELRARIISQLRVASRLFVTTRNCRLGLTRSCALAGDEIWFLNGASAPIVLRPLANGNYSYRGEAYMYGLMHGEVVDLMSEDERVETRISVE